MLFISGNFAGLLHRILCFLRVWVQSRQLRLSFSSKSISPKLCCWKACPQGFLVASCCPTSRPARSFLLSGSQVLTPLFPHGYPRHNCSSSQLRKPWRQNFKTLENFSSHLCFIIYILVLASTHNFLFNFINETL